MAVSATPAPGLYLLHRVIIALPRGGRLSFVHLFPGLSSAPSGVFLGREIARRFAPLPAVNRVERAGESAKEALSESRGRIIGNSSQLDPAGTFVPRNVARGDERARERTSLLSPRPLREKSPRKSVFADATGFRGLDNGGENESYSSCAPEAGDGGGKKREIRVIRASPRNCN